MAAQTRSNKSPRVFRSADPTKSRTGIEGLDHITGGGFPRGRATLIEGGPGCGKTILALQSLVNGVFLENEPGIFVAFEESPDRIKGNAAKFGWDLAALERKKLFFLDAQPSPELIQSGTFDLGGMLAALEAKAREIGARRIVFDAVDIVLSLLPDMATARQEIYRLHNWLLEHELTAIITAKEIKAPSHLQLNFMQFMVDCAVILKHEVVQGISLRTLRVMKYRGSAFGENEAPFLIGKRGLEVAGARESEPVKIVLSNERVSSGVAPLDEMLGGGYYRGSSVLITGFPGTAKSTMAGEFAQAACERGEPTVFASFDSDANEVVRNLSSVGIRLERFIRKGLLRLIWVRSVSGSAETHLLQIRTQVMDVKARNLVVDPISALSKGGNEGMAHNVAERLVDWTKASGITLLCTSLLDDGEQAEGTPLQISTIADTWIHLNYLVHGGERNRGLSIVKSRGTAHSNQVRELVLHKRGVTLTDVYTAGGEVLAGTLRWEKERAERARLEEAQVAGQQKQTALDIEAMDLQARLKILEMELAAKLSQKAVLKRHEEKRASELLVTQDRVRQLRGTAQR
jgi:circadian clock protein KaiC